jgi:hypothetical protein
VLLEAQVDRAKKMMVFLAWVLRIATGLAGIVVF